MTWLQDFLAAVYRVSAKPERWTLAQHASTGWRWFPYPATDRLPPKPWHPDGDEAFRTIPTQRHPRSAEMIAHLKATGRLNLNLGSTQPGEHGKVSGYPLNVAKPTDPAYMISKEPGPRMLYVHRGDYQPDSQWGTTVRINLRRMRREYFPMEPPPDAWKFGDVKCHILDPQARTITEIQYLTEEGDGLRCHGVTQYSLDEPSAAVQGRSAAKQPLAEQTLRYDDLIGPDGQPTGWTQRATMAITSAAKDKFVAPALGTDGKNTAPDAPPLGVALRVKGDVVRRKLAVGLHPQAQAVLACWAGPGIMLVDSGGNHTTSLEPDNRWDRAALAPLAALTLDDFEVWTL